MKGIRLFALVFCFMVMSSWLQAQIPARVVSANPPPETVHISLDSSWRLFFFSQGKFQIGHPDQLKTQKLTSIEASVPGEAALDLSRRGELPADLFFADNITKLKPYELYEWWYQRDFPTPPGITGRRLELRFHGVDCLATYWLNGTELGESSDALVEQNFDVTGKLNSKRPNNLTVRLRSPIIEAASKEYDPAYTILSSGRTNQEAVWIRRPVHSYGWGIMPRAVSAGLWRPVELIVHAQHEIADMHFTTLSVQPGRATLAVSYELSTDPALPSQLRLNVVGRCGESTFTYSHKLQFTAGMFRVEVQNPALWWPRG